MWHPIDPTLCSSRQNDIGLTVPLDRAISVNQQHFEKTAMSRSMLKRPLRTLPIIEAMRPWRAGQYQHSL